MNLTTLLSPDAVFARLDAGSKKQALKMLADEGERLTGIGAGEIFSTLMEREQMTVGALGGGVAIPHARFDRLMRLCGVFTTLARPVEYGAPDGQPVDIVFMLLIPSSPGPEPLKAIAAISRLLRDKTICERLRAAENAADLHALIAGARA